jgi:microcystin degradation protein MlrC
MKRFTVFAASFMHETHSFSPVQADLENFQASDYYLGDDIPKAYGGTRHEFGAILDAADEFGWNLIHPISVSTMPSGTVTRRAFEHISDIITDGVKESEHLDGIILALHGAMATEHVEDAEAELVRRVRAIVGPEVPIAVSLDIHANAGPDLARYANIVSTYRTTPHVDIYETADRAARLLQRAMVGEIRPTLVYSQKPMFYGLDMGRTITGSGPMVSALEKASALLAAHEPILDISINAGFDWSDKKNIGSSVLVTHDGVPSLAQTIADDLMDFAWATRAEKTVRLLSVDEAVEVAITPSSDGRPLLIGDYTDCPGGGAAGDGTNLLRALLSAPVRDVAYGSIADPRAVEIAIAAGVGAVVQLELGGKIDPKFGGGPVALTGTVKAISDGNVVRKGAYYTGTTTAYGPSCLVQVGEIKIIVATNRVQIDDREQFRIFGIQPETTNVLVCKAVNHFRADFEKIGRQLIYVESGGIMSTNFAQFPFKNVRRPIWPLDDL